MKQVILLAIGVAMLLPALCASQGINLPRAVTVGSDGTVYSASNTLHASGAMEIDVVAIDGGGSIQGSATVGGAHMLASGIVTAGAAVVVGATEIHGERDHDIVVMDFDRAELVRVNPPPAPLSLEISPVRPNPTGRGRGAEIELMVRTECHVTIDLYQAAGAVFARIIDTRFSPGQHTVHIDATALPAGAYFCMLSADGARAVQKFIVLR